METLQQIEAARLQEKLRRAAHFTPLVEALEGAFASWFDKPSNIEKVEPKWVADARAALDSAAKE